MRVLFCDSIIEKFVLSLDKRTQAKVLRTIELLERFGHQLSSPHTKKVADKIFELRTHGANNVRIFYIFRDKAAVLLHGFVKKTQKIPKRELDMARNKLK